MQHILDGKQATVNATFHCVSRGCILLALSFWVFPCPPQPFPFARLSSLSADWQTACTACSFLCYIIILQTKLSPLENMPNGKHSSLLKPLEGTTRLQQRVQTAQTQARAPCTT